MKPIEKGAKIFLTLIFLRETNILAERNTLQKIKRLLNPV